MAKKTGKGRSGLPLGIGIFLLIFFLVAATAGTAVVLTLFAGQESAHEEVVDDVVGSLSVQSSFQQHRYRQLQLITRIFSTDLTLPVLLAEAAEERDAVKVLDLVSEYQNILNFDLAVVLDQGGQLLARTDDPKAEPVDLSGLSLVALGIQEEIAYGILQEGDDLYHAAAVPLEHDFELYGYVVAGFAIDDALALQIGRISGTSVAYIANSPTGPTVVASNLESGAPADLVTALRTQADALNRVNRGNTVDGVELEWGGGRYLAALSPLKDAAGETVGAGLALTSLDQKLTGYRLIRFAVLGVGAVALLVGALGAQLLSRTARGPMRRLAETAERVGGGDLSTPVEAPAGGDAARVAQALDLVRSDLREKASLEGFVGQLARALPEPARGGGEAVRPQTRKTALVAVDMRRFANPKIGYDAEESLGRFARDLRRISTSVEAQRGKIESVFGHRVLASFEGEGAAMHALSAATEILKELSERENVFDEPEPPAVVATSGNVVAGTITGAGGSRDALAGLPLQQLESVLRESTPGELFLAKPIFAELAGVFQQAGIQISPQRGLMSPQPLYVVGLQAAAQVTGVELEATAASFPGERASLSEVVPGAVIGGRFELLAEIGAGRLGVTWKARDRDRDQYLALKILKPEIVADENQLGRLRTVIRQWRSISHPNLVAIYDFAEAGGLPYISSEFVRAMSLRFVLEKSRQVPPLAGVALARQILRGLAEAHREKLLHGGLEPADVLVEPSGRVKLKDFGLAPPAAAGVAVVGSPEYLAPEQLEGRAGEARSDLYACGAIFYEILTGEVPFSAPTPQELRQKVLSADAPPPSGSNADVPAKLDEIVLRLLAKTPEGRYASAEEALEALESVRG